ncbi:MAG: hypothetical protein RIM23_01690 [Coleofasciculus sp. G3-WIS-01]|uniref:hypothetical protein n=1 Tax=Coleofasciculus sp. G3-WIS-01 TaxID=3069528 RepID=UPI00330301D9
MASEQQVKRYLAYWFQVGKKVVVRNGENVLQPQRIIAGDRYSQEFEELWQYLLSPESGDCYLTGTSQTISELLTSKWDLEPCSRCDMPVPMFNVGSPPESCTCNDLSNWPNTDLPTPREPINTQNRLSAIHQRLRHGENREGGDRDRSPDPKNQTRESSRLPESLNQKDYLRLVRDRSCCPLPQTSTEPTDTR